MVKGVSYMKTEKGMVKIKRIYDPVSRDDGSRILVDRLWPRGLRKGDVKIDEWLKEIAPSNELRRWFGHDPAKWQQFRKKYSAELADKSELLEKLKASARKGTITLLFAAKDVAHNNAFVLKELIEHS
jgi:uncharacterized protein YeaO (DUF488 family)